MKKDTFFAALLFAMIFCAAVLMNGCSAANKNMTGYDLSSWNHPQEDWMTVRDWNRFLECTVEPEVGDWGCDSCYHAVFGIWPE